MFNFGNGIIGFGFGIPVVMPKSMKILGILIIITAIALSIEFCYTIDTMAKDISIIKQEIVKGN